jgi:hypothetical protein
MQSTQRGRLLEAQEGHTCSTRRPRSRYEAEFIFARAAMPSDLSNRIKALEDWLQRVELIENDKYCERLVAEWGRAPLGVRVRLRTWEEI